MLNDLMQLSESIRSASIKPFSWHPKWQMGSKVAFVLEINSRGRVVNAELVQDESEAGSLRKFSEGNTSGSFPGVNVPFLYKDPGGKIRPKDFKNTTSDTKKLFSALKALKSEWSNKKTEARFRKCLNEVPEEFLKQLGDLPDKFRVIGELAKRVKLVTPKTLHEDLLKCAQNQIRKNSGLREVWIRRLLYDTRSTTAYLVFDVSDPQKFPYSMNCEKTREWINTRLFAFDKESNKQDGGTDAYGGGFSRKEVEGVFPKVKIPVLGKFSLFSRNRDADSNIRYGLNGPDTFIVGNENRQKQKDALEWITAEERKNKTWKDISGTFGYNGKKPIKTLLFAYPTNSPEQSPELATLFGGNQGSESRFAEYSKIVLQWLEKFIPEKPNAEIKLLCLSKPDDYNTRIVFSECVTTKRLLENIKEWQTGCTNIPNIYFKTHSKLGVVATEVPSPADVARLVNYAWCRQGSHAEYLYGIKFGEILRLFLDDKNTCSKSVEKIILRLVLNNAVSLLSEAALCSTANQTITCDKESIPILKPCLSLLPSIVGLVLYRLSINKEQYMDKPEFLLGKLFNMCDLLHVQYATRDLKEGESKERHGVPGVLIGNESYRQALQNPSRAFSRLADRIAVYQAWAATSGNKLSRFALKEIGLVSNKLRQLELPTLANDVSKAQLLMGYLSRKEEDEKAEKVEKK